MGIGGSELFTAIVVLAVVVLVFLLLREFWCWFFKINAILETLREIRDKLRS